MALLTIEGHYENGQINLKEAPAGVEKARVIVTFLDIEADEEARRAAIARLVAGMKEGIDFGGQKFDRNALYKERMQELDARRSQNK